MTEDQWTDRKFHQWERAHPAACECGECEECHEYHKENRKAESYCDRCSDEWCSTCGWTAYDKDGFDCDNPSCPYGIDTIRMSKDFRFCSKCDKWCPVVTLNYGLEHNECKTITLSWKDWKKIELEKIRS